MALSQMFGYVCGVCQREVKLPMTNDRDIPRISWVNEETGGHFSAFLCVGCEPTTNLKLK